MGSLFLFFGILALFGGAIYYFRQKRAGHPAPAAPRGERNDRPGSGDRHTP